MFGGFHFLVGGLAIGTRRGRETMRNVHFHPQSVNRHAGRIEVQRVIVRAGGDGAYFAGFVFVENFKRRRSCADIRQSKGLGGGVIVVYFHLQRAAAGIDAGNGEINRLDGISNAGQVVADIKSERRAGGGRD